MWHKPQKDHFQLRDDVAALFDNLISLTTIKIHHFHNLINNYHTIVYRLNAGSYTIINTYFHLNQRIIENIDAINYDISQVIINICNKTGIDSNDFYKYFKNIKNNKIIEYFKTHSELEKFIKSVYHLNNKINTILNSDKRKIKMDIQNIKRIIQLKSNMKIQ